MRPGDENKENVDPNIVRAGGSSRGGGPSRGRVVKKNF
jgi:hypothetical protein